MAVTKQVQHAMHNHQSHLLGQSGAHPSRLAGHIVGGNDYVPEMQRGAAFTTPRHAVARFHHLERKRQHVGGAPIAAVSKIHLRHLPLGNQGDIHETVSAVTLPGQHPSRQTPQ